MSLFNKKSKEEKILEDIKKKKEQMDKLKEEIIKMGKLVLKDGKLTKVDDVTKESVTTGTTVPIPEIQGYADTDVDEMVQQERLRRQQGMSIPQPVQQPRPLSQEEYNSMKQQQDLYNYQQQLAQQEAEQREYMRQQQELYQQQQMRQQPQPYQPPQQIPMVGITIEMVTGSIINVRVPGDKIDSFVEGLNMSIDNQSSFPINNKVINGRNIVSYTIE